MHIICTPPPHTHTLFLFARGIIISNLIKVFNQTQSKMEGMMTNSNQKISLEFSPEHKKVNSIVHQFLIFSIFLQKYQEDQYLQVTFPCRYCCTPVILLIQEVLITRDSSFYAKWLVDINLWDMIKSFYMYFSNRKKKVIPFHEWYFSLDQHDSSCIFRNLQYSLWKHFSLTNTYSIRKQM